MCTNLTAIVLANSIKGSLLESPGRFLSQDASKLMFNRTISVSDLLSWKEETVQYVAHKEHVEIVILYDFTSLSKDSALCNYIDNNVLSKFIYILTFRLSMI